MSEDKKDQVSTIRPVNVDEIKEIFCILIKMDVRLDEDPIRFGPKRLNEKLGIARGFLSDCEALYTKVVYRMRLYQRAHIKKKTQLDLRMKHLLATDPETRAAGAVRDREATATIKLQDFLMEVESLENSIQELETVLSVIKAKRTDLKDIQGRIRDQFKVCQEEINLGSYWGDDDPTITPIPIRPMSDWVSPALLDDLQDLVQEAGDMPQNLILRKEESGSSDSTKLEKGVEESLIPEDLHFSPNVDTTPTFSSPEADDRVMTDVEFDTMLDRFSI